METVNVLSLFELENRNLRSLVEDTFDDIDYGRINLILEKERERSMRYLDVALSANEQVFCVESGITMKEDRAVEHYSELGDEDQICFE